VGTLRDWEQHQTEPDRAALSYLKVIEADADSGSGAMPWLQQASLAKPCEIDAVEALTGGSTRAHQASLLSNEIIWVSPTDCAAWSSQDLAQPATVLQRLRCPSLRRVWLHLDLVGTRPGLRQLIGQLHPHKMIHLGPEGLLDPKRHIRG